MSHTSIVVVDDDPDVRGVIAALLARDHRFQIVGQAGDGAAGVEEVRRRQPDVVLLDLAMPVMDGLTALPLIQAASPRSRVVVLSAFGTDSTVAAAMAAGAEAFLHKGGSLPEMLIPTLSRAAAI